MMKESSKTHLLLLLLTISVTLGSYQFFGESEFITFSKNSVAAKTSYFRTILHIIGGILVLSLLLRWKEKVIQLLRLVSRWFVSLLKECFFSSQGAKNPTQTINDVPQTWSSDGETFSKSSCVERILLSFGVFSIVWMIVRAFDGGLHHYTIAIVGVLPFCIYWVLKPAISSSISQLRPVVFRAQRHSTEGRSNLVEPSPISDLSTPTSDLPSPTSDIRSPISHLRYPISDIRSPISELPSPNRTFPQNWLVLTFFSVLLVFLYFYINRPDSDDSTYLRVGLFGLVYPLEPFENLEIKHVTEIAPGIRLNSSYDLFRAIPSHVFDLPLLVSYYATVPPLLIATFPFLLSVFFRELFGLQKFWILLAIAITLLLLFVWSDSHRSPANFGIVRAFQGKGIYSTIIVPLQILCFIRLTRHPDIRRGVEAMLATATGVFFTMNALIVGTFLFVVLVVLPSLLQRRWQIVAFGIPAMGYVAILLSLGSAEAIKSRFNPNYFPDTIGMITSPLSNENELVRHDKGVPKSRADREQIQLSASVLPEMQWIAPTRILAASFHRDPSALVYRSNLEIVQYALGVTARSYLILLTSFLLLFTRADPGIKRLTLLISALFLLPGLLGSLAAASSAPMAWRIFWALPIALIVPGSLVWTAANGYYTGRKPFALGGLLIWILTVTIPGNTVFNKQNGMQGTTLGFSPIKLDTNGPFRAETSEVIELDGFWLLHNGKRY